jgi:hypothetical protein
MSQLALAMSRALSLLDQSLAQLNQLDLEQELVERVERVVVVEQSALPLAVRCLHGSPANHQR